VDEVRARLEAGNHEFLRHVDYKTMDPSHALRLGPEAPYYLAIIYRSLSMPEMERRMLEVGGRFSTGIWREESRMRLLELALEAKEYQEVVRGGAALAGRVRDAERAGRLRRLRLDALYGMGNTRGLLELLSVHLSLSPDPEALLAGDPDLELYAAVGAALTEEPEWEERFRRVLWNRPASGLHARALAFLERDGRRLASFSTPEIELYRGKAALGEVRREAAAVLISRALRSLRVPPGSVVIEETGRLYLALGRHAEGIVLLEAIRPQVADTWVLDEFRGRLLRASGSRAAAALALESSFRSSPEPGQRQRALWQYLDLRIQAGETSLGRLFWNRREYVADGAYFSDLLEGVVTTLVARRRWDELETLRSFARETSDLVTLARTSFILSRAVTAGLIPQTAARDPAVLLEEVLEADPGGYHALLASHLLGRTYVRLACDGGPESVQSAPRRLENGWQAALPELIVGYFHYGLPLLGYREIGQLGEAAPDDAALRAARELQAGGHYVESIRLATALISRAGACGDRAHLLLSYPALYLSDVERMAGEHEVPLAGVLALVREESAFEAEAVSWVGAVGLTQLMPPTAEEVARRLGMRAPDLTDPLTNLRLGIWHLAGLRQYAGAFSRVMMAYNAGLGRLRSWEREFGPLPDELFAEAVPYSETRLYARQVLVAAVIYGVLYLDTPLGDTVTLFFPELSPLGYPAAP
jgi:soluble lytic murein transglycosylase-like protein